MAFRATWWESRTAQHPDRRRRAARSNIRRRPSRCQSQSPPPSPHPVSMLPPLSMRAALTRTLFGCAHLKRWNEPGFRGLCGIPRAGGKAWLRNFEQCSVSIPGVHQFEIYH
jgi:hypothetical protein